jgi:hypothetical protein
MIFPDIRVVLIAWMILASPPGLNQPDYRGGKFDFGFVGKERIEK